MGGTSCSIRGALLDASTRLESESEAVVDEPIQDDIGEGRIAEISVPILDGELTADVGGTLVVAIVEDLQEISFMLRQTTNWPARNRKSTGRRPLRAA
jgi:hypothetical protein